LKSHFGDLFTVGEGKSRRPDVCCIEAIGGNLGKYLFNIFVGWIESIPANAWRLCGLSDVLSHLLIVYGIGSCSDQEDYGQSRQSWQKLLQQVNALGCEVKSHRCQSGNVRLRVR
jgi:hypothetical protein